MFITNLGKDNMLLGTDWLKYHDPSIRWRRREVHFDWCPEECWQPYGLIKAREEPSRKEWLMKLRGDKIFLRRKPHLVQEPAGPPWMLIREQMRQVPTEECKSHFIEIIRDKQ